MPTPLGTVIRLARSPTGRRAVHYAIRVARTKEGRKLIAQTRKVASSPDGRRLIKSVKALLTKPAEPAKTPRNQTRFPAIRNRVPRRKL